jgi:hypothetical protein
MTRPAYSLGLFSILCTLSLALSGCASQKPPPAPKVQLGVDHFTGSVLSGPSTRPAEIADPSTALWVQVKLLAVQGASISEMAPIGSRVKLIASSRGGEPILPSGILTRGTRWAENDDVAKIESKLTAGRDPAAQVIGEQQFIVPRSVTASIDLTDGETPAGNPRMLRLLMHQPAADPASLELALAVLDDYTAPQESSDEPAASSATTRPSPQPQYLREVAVLREIPANDPVQAAVLVPFAFSDGLHHSMLALIHVSRGVSGPDVDAAIARCNEDLKQSAEQASLIPLMPTLTIADNPGFDAALAAIRKPQTRRASLAYLAGQTGAAVCEDLALTATDESLEQFCGEMFRLLENMKAPYTADSLGWALDSAALRFLGQLQSGNKIPDELLSVLLRHSGQVGANSGSIEEIVKAVGNRKDLVARLVADNFVYLEDNSPAARVRAYDWLNARGEAPAGYDPLAPPRERQNALQKAYDAMAAKSAPQGGKP